MGGFVEKILYFQQHCDESAVMGQDARRVAEEEFGGDKLDAQTLSVLETKLT